MTLQLHTKDGIRDATPEEEAIFKANFESDIDKLVAYAKKQGWI